MITEFVDLEMIPNEIIQGSEFATMDWENNKNISNTEESELADSDFKEYLEDTLTGCAKLLLSAAAEARLSFIKNIQYSKLEYVQSAVGPIRRPVFIIEMDYRKFLKYTYKHKDEVDDYLYSRYRKRDGFIPYVPLYLEALIHYDQWPWPSKGCRAVVIDILMNCMFDSLITKIEAKEEAFLSDILEISNEAYYNNRHELNMSL